MSLELKQKQFNSAMELYESKKSYKLLGRFVSVTNISLQIYVLSLVFTFAIGFWWQIVSVIAAYLITDFINGLVHLYSASNMPRPWTAGSERLVVYLPLLPSGNHRLMPMSTSTKFLTSEGTKSVTHHCRPDDFFIGLWINYWNIMKYALTLRKY